MKTLLLIILTILTFLQASSQKFNVSSIDTLRLQNPIFKKTLRYETNLMTIFIDYEMFKQSFDKFWKQYQRGVKSYLKSEKKDPESVNKQWFKIWLFLDSMHVYFATQIKLGDTVSIKESTFARLGIGTGHSFDIQLENGQCSVLDKYGNFQSVIIRKREQYQRDFLDGWGGRRYYFLNSVNPFYSATDWRS